MIETVEIIRANKYPRGTDVLSLQEEVLLYINI